MYYLIQGVRQSGGSIPLAIVTASIYIYVCIVENDDVNPINPLACL